MDKHKGRWQEIPDNDDWEYITSKYNLTDKDWNLDKPESLDKFKKDKITLNEFGGGLKGGMSEDTIVFGGHMDLQLLADAVNNPPHYQQGSQEVIDIIEGAIASAPEPVTAMLQAQVLKYLLRMWHKDNPVEDAKKAQWYLNRLVTSL